MPDLKDRTNKDDVDDARVNDILKGIEDATSQDEAWRNSLRRRAAADQEEAAAQQDAEQEEEEQTEAIRDAETSPTAPANDTIGSGFKREGDNKPTALKSGFRIGKLGKFAAKRWLIGALIP
ncbi:MAG TPA: hypothetical protein VD735_03775, partial [Candidatus Saccharimonadales bacterium]|nr:hypothetical protein [Candidatus Saccharimonadales bacterium]